jgi:hypothetical protein
MIGLGAGAALCSPCAAALGLALGAATLATQAPTHYSDPDGSGVDGLPGTVMGAASVVTSLSALPSESSLRNAGQKLQALYHDTRGGITIGSKPQDVVVALQPDDGAVVWNAFETAESRKSIATADLSQVEGPLGKVTFVGHGKLDGTVAGFNHEQLGPHLKNLLGGRRPQSVEIDACYGPCAIDAPSVSSHLGVPVRHSTLNKPVFFFEGRYTYVHIYATGEAAVLTVPTRVTLPVVR